jgi:serine/threonine protein kinase
MYNLNIIPRMRRRFPGLVIQVVNEQLPAVAREVYNQTIALPQTETEQQLQVIGYQLYDSWHGNDNFLLCHKETKTYLLKVLASKEYTRAVALQESLNGKTCSYITSFEILSHREKNFMIMPFYVSTLETIRLLSMDVGRRVVQQISEAIQFLHEEGFIHMDIKPSNICLNEAGDAVLVDLGSVVRRSSSSQLSTSESTVVYMPHDFQPRSKDSRSNNQYVAEDLCDWWMLAMTIAEKIYGVEVGRTKTLDIDSLISLLRSDFPDIVAYLL